MKKSAGLLMYRLRGGLPEVLLGHPGGPFWARKDLGAWGMPKGEYEEGEAPLAAARREFAEETGCVPEGDFIALGEARQKSGKHITAWGFAGTFDPQQLEPGRFEMEWPPRSGRMRSFPELDRVQWFDLAEAAVRILPGQAVFLQRLADVLGLPPPAG